MHRLAGVPARDRQSDLAGTESAKAGSEPGAAVAGCPIECDLTRVGGESAQELRHAPEDANALLCQSVRAPDAAGSKHIFHRETSVAQVMTQEVFEPCVRDGHR